MVALSVLSLAPAARAQSFFVNSLDSGKLSSALQNPGSAYGFSSTPPADRTISNGTGNRVYIRTGSGDYNLTDFAFSVDVDTRAASASTPDRTVFFGLGSGEPDGSNAGVPALSLGLEFGTDANAQAFLRTHGVSAEASTTIGSVPAPGVFTVQLVKTGDRLRFTIMQGETALATGVQSVTKNAAFLRGGGFHLYFGTAQAGVTFNNIRVVRSGVLTAHNDTARTGQYLDENTLNPASLTSQTFGLRFTDSVDGQVYAQPLYVGGVRTGDGSTHNIVYVATQHNSLYAFDADKKGAALWQKNFGPSVPSDDTNTGDIKPEIGITSTPVIDPASGTLFVVAKTKEDGNYLQRLHALDIATGSERTGSPVTIAFSVPGTGAGSGGGTVAFNPLRENQRAALLLSQGKVYIAWASHGDNDPYHGWVAAYDAASLSLASVFNDTPNGSRGGIWQSGAGPSVDGAGRIFLSAGNGTFDPGTGNFGEGVLSFTPSLSLRDYFVPFNYADLNRRDADLGSSGVLLLPEQKGSVAPHLALAGGKAGVLYLVNRDSLGGYNPNGNPVVQTLEQDDDNGLYSAPAYFAGHVYYARANDTLKSRRLFGKLSKSPTSQSAETYRFPGASPSVSADGAKNGIVWTLARGTNATLLAYDASDLSRELYSSNDAAQGRDVPGPYVKFSVPTVAKGRVYVGTGSALAVFGRL